MFEVIISKTGIIPVILLRVPAMIGVEKLRTSFFVWIMSTQATYDFIIIGGGTTGSVVAARLAENSNVKILVIEAGHMQMNPRKFPGSPSLTPARASHSRSSKTDWSYQIKIVDKPDYERVEKLNTRSQTSGERDIINLFWQSACTRGSKATFDEWAGFGGDNWTWDKCQEYFNMGAEYYHDDKDSYQEESTQTVHPGLLAETKQLCDALTKAWTGMGYTLQDDSFDGKLEVISHGRAGNIHGRLWSNRAELAESKANIDIMSMTIATKLNFEGNVAKSVTVLTDNHEEATIKARHEIILACGVFETPKLLLLSGIGPRTELARHGIDPILESEHVGKNLLDHPILPHVFSLKKISGQEKCLFQMGPAPELAVRQFGDIQTGSSETVLPKMSVFLRIDDTLAEIEEFLSKKQENGGKDPFGPNGQPHFEIDFVPTFADVVQWNYNVPSDGKWLTVVVNLARPQSRSGYVRLDSLDPHEEPSINMNFFSDELDVMMLREGVRFIDNILMHGNSMKDIIDQDSLWPMPRDSDEDMDQMILDRSQSGLHPCGTARLSLNIRQGVVDPQLGVHGVRHLRIIDASVIPVIPDCQIQSTVYMIGEKGSDLVRSSYSSLFT